MTLRWYDSIDSTNTEALRHIGEWEHMTVLAAREQTAGRGQRGNSWFAEPGQNLTFSIVVRPVDFPAADAVWLNYLASDVVASFLNGYGVRTTIKWPNDIYVGKDKICGMLIENTLRGNALEASVIGIGINVNQQAFPQLASATSLRRCLGRELDLKDCLQAFMALFEGEWPRLYEDRAGLFASYSSRLFRKDCEAHYRDLLEDREYTGILRGVIPDGRLHIYDQDQQADRYYRFKEVSYIL